MSRVILPGRPVGRYGAPVVEGSRHLGVTERTYFRSRNQHGGVKCDDAKRLKELESANFRLKRIVASQGLDIDTTK